MLAFQQFSLPGLTRGVVEALLFAAIFATAASFSLGLAVIDYAGTMAIVVFVMLACMVASGVYRDDISEDIAKVYLHSGYGYLLAMACFLMLMPVLPEVYSRPKFVFFFLFLSFFAISTLRPVICGTSFINGGGRRHN